MSSAIFSNLDQSTILSSGNGLMHLSGESYQASQQTTINLQNLLLYDILHNHGVQSFNTLPNDKILDWSKLKQIAHNILKCI